MQQNATVSLNLSDVFNSRRFVLNTRDDNLLQERKFNRESRIFTIALTYRFGGYRDRDAPVSNGEGEVMEDGLF
jgi:iron complex outermembrane recepter protein